MSRFFATASDTESDSESSVEEAPIRPQAIPTYAFSDEEEEQKRVVRSAKEKRYSEMQELIKQIRNYKKIKDLSNMLSCFEDLTKAYSKALTIIQKEEGGATPRFFLRCLVEMETFLNDLWEDREGRKNLSKNNSKSLSTLRQKLRKFMKDFETEVATFKETMDVEDEPDEDAKAESEESESEDDEGPQAFRKADSEPRPAKAKPAKPAAMDSDDSDDSYWGADSEDETSSSEDEREYTSLREKFLKKTTQEEEEQKKKDKKERKEKEKEKRRLRREEEEEDELEAQAGGEWETVRGGVPMPARPKMFAKDAEITVGVVMKKLNEVLAARGKKGTDRREQVEMIHELLTAAEANNLGPAVNMKLKLAVVASIFDYNPKISDAMKAEHWEKLLKCVEEILDVLVSRNDLDLGEHVTEESERLDPADVAKAPASDQVFRIRGCMLTILERADEEFVKLLKECDAHSNEYVERLKDETTVCRLIDRLQTYLEKRKPVQPLELSRLYLRKIEHLYYKFDPDVLKQRAKEIGSEVETSLQVMDKVCKYIYNQEGAERLRQRAFLCHIYHLALHDDWYGARDLMLMSHLQESIHLSDPSTQILYNRTMVQLGLCAFRHGHIKEAHHALLDIQSGGRAKELLAQGLLLQRQHERTSEQEKIEKQRQIPFHMHINLELLECVYLVSAMLIEIPYMAAHESDARRRMISKSFHHQLKVSERQAVTGPPESMREHVVAASKAMRKGQWQPAVLFLINEKMNAKVWDLFYQAEHVRAMLKRKVQEESLRTYLFTYSSVYDSLSLPTLGAMFELEPAAVHSILSRMILNEELMASLDEPSQTVVMHRTEPSRLQGLALQLADKLGSLVENNERILEVRQGPFFMRGGAAGGGGGFRGGQGYGGRGNRDREAGGQGGQGNQWNRRQDRRNQE